MDQTDQHIPPDADGMPSAILCFLEPRTTMTFSVPLSLFEGFQRIGLPAEHACGIAKLPFSSPRATAFTRKTKQPSISGSWAMCLGLVTTLKLLN
jgi:hypothetical protein